MHQSQLAGLRDSLRGWHRSNSIPQPVDSAAFDIHAAQVSPIAITRCLCQQSAGLFRVRDITAEENDSGGAHQLKPRALEASQFDARQSYNKQASGSLTDGNGHFWLRPPAGAVSPNSCFNSSNKFSA